MCKYSKLNLNTFALSCSNATDLYMGRNYSARPGAARLSNVNFRPVWLRRFVDRPAGRPARGHVWNAVSAESRNGCCDRGLHATRRNCDCRYCRSSGCCLNLSAHSSARHPAQRWYSSGTDCSSTAACRPANLGGMSKEWLFAGYRTILYRICAI